MDYPRRLEFSPTLLWEPWTWWCGNTSLLHLNLLYFKNIKCHLNACYMLFYYNQCRVICLILLRHVIYIYLKDLIQFVGTKPSVCWTVAFTIPVNWDAIRPPVISAISFIVSGKFTLWHGQHKSLLMSICNWVLNCCYFCRISCTFLLIYTICVGNILMNISFWWQLLKRYSGTVKISWVNMFNKTYRHTFLW